MHRIPLGLAALLLLSGCGGAPTALPEPSTIPTSYRYDLSAFCGERSFRGDYRVTVRDGEVVAARPLDAYSPPTDLVAVPTLQDLVDRPDDVEPDADVTLDLSPDGLPRLLYIDHVPEAIDDEECYEVSRVRRLGEDRWPQA